VPVTDIPWAVADLNARAEAIRLRQDYYDGRHRSMLPQGKTLTPELRRLLDDLDDNLCDDVVNEPVNRMVLIAWNATGGSDAQRKAIAQAAQESWEINRGAARSRDVHRNGWKTGDGWTIVQQDQEGPVRWYSQRPECMAARYSKERPDEMEVAAKCWRDGGRWRLNLYYPPSAEHGGKPHLERYTTKGTANDGSVPQAKSFLPYYDEAAQVDPVEVLDGDRIPVFHYPADEIGCYGRAALTSSVINLQDVLNKSFVDLVVSMEGHSLPDRYATGIQAEYDPETGREKPLKATGRERMIRTGAKEATFGQFPQADLANFHTTQDKVRAEIARKGKLPAYSVASDSGQAPSGLSLLIQEGSLIKRCLTAQDDWGVTWKEQQAYTLRLGGMDGVTAADLDMEWAPPGTRDETALLEALTLKVALGLPKREALIQSGEDPEDVDTWLDAAQARADVIRGGSGLEPMAAPVGGMLPGAPVQPNGAVAPSAVAP
jgi:hypothetical protein